MMPDVDIFGLSIKTFGVFFALNFVAWGLLCARRLKELGKPTDWAYEIVFVALVGGLIGARGYYLLQNHQSLSFGDIFGGAGLIWYGGLAGGIIGLLLWAWRRRFLTMSFVDIAGPSLALGYAIGRIGCQVAGDGDYGKPSNLPWAMSYPDGTVPTPPGVTVQPTPIYETLAMGLLAWVLWRLRDRVRPGILFALYLVFGGLERFLIEFIRRNEHVAIGLTAAQFESIALMIAGLVWIAIAARTGGVLRRAGAPPGRKQARPVAVSG